jgi:hypothetical protein
MPACERRAKKDIAALNSKLDGYKTIESDLKAEFAEREVRLNQQLSDAHHRLQELEVENKKVNHLMDVIEATEKLAVGGWPRFALVSLVPLF